MSMSHLARDIASRFHHRGSYVATDGLDLNADLREIAGTNLTDQRAQFEMRRAEILSSYGMMGDDTSREKCFAYSDGVAIIPIHGLLINRLSWSCSYATGYNFIRSQRMAALADPDVKLIAYDVNSHGGIASGCAELAREMFDSRAEKPSIAVVDARCYSAAYFLASACDKIVVTPSGGVGSIGCLSMHIDYSDMVAADGIKVTFIFAGADKVDGNPYERLSARAKATIQRDVDYHYGLFIEAVARHRGMSEDDVRATEAGCFLPPEALDNGLIDAIETPAEAVANFFNEITSDAEAEGDNEMTTATKISQPGNTGNSVTVPATNAVTEVLSREDFSRMVAEEVSAARTAERTRQAGIRNCDEAKGREPLANHLANDTDLSVDVAKGILAAAPKAPETTDTNGGQRPSGFAGAMDATGNPVIRPDAGTGAVGTGADEDTPESRANRLLTAYGAASGTVIELRPAHKAA
jgi:signal peptide peptidase SppA